MPDLPGWQVASFPGDDVKDILYYTIPNIRKKKIVGQGYYDGSIQSMAELLENRIEKLEKSIHPNVPSRNKKNNYCKKRKAVIFKSSQDEDSDEEEKGKTFCKYHDMCRHTMNECTTLKALFKQAKQIRKVK